VLFYVYRCDDCSSSTARSVAVGNLMSRDHNRDLECRGQGHEVRVRVSVRI